MIRKTPVTLFLVITLGVLGGAGTGVAAGIENDRIRIRLGEAGIERGYTLTTPSEKFTVGLFPNIVDRPARVTLVKGTKRGLILPVRGLRRVSDIYEYDIKTEPVQTLNRDAVLVLKYTSETLARRQIRYWDSINRRWVPLPSVDLSEQRAVRAFSRLPYSKIAVFENTNVYEGRASWYRSASRPMTAASNEYELGSSVRVTNIENGRSVIVRIVSRGPFVPGRIIDLTADAFGQLAPIGSGVISVRVEPSNNRGAAPAAPNPSGVPSISASSAIVLDPVSGQALYEKQPAQKPIASITKLMTVLVYLEHRRSDLPFDQEEVTYEAEDNVNNAVESHLSLQPGDRLAADELLKAVLIASANNATKTLARSTGLARDAFVAEMNRTARRLGMLETRFVEPSGIDPGNVSTPRDIAKLVNHLMNRNGIRTMTVQQSDRISANTGNPNGRNERIIDLRNTNHLFSSGLPMFGGKTGFLGPGRGTFALKFVAGDRQRIVVILGSASGASRNADMVALATWAMAQP